MKEDATSMADVTMDANSPLDTQAKGTQSSLTNDPRGALITVEPDHVTTESLADSRKGKSVEAFIIMKVGANLHCHCLGLGY